MTILAIDPGTDMSGYCFVDRDTLKIVSCAKVRNEKMLEIVYESTYDECVIEMVQYYGKFMNAGQTLFDTCVWIGRFTEAVWQEHNRPKLIYRTTVKAHITGMSSSKDAQVRQCLIDRFGGKGTKAAPGFFFGVSADMFSAFALAVAYIETATQA